MKRLQDAKPFTDEEMNQVFTEILEMIESGYSKQKIFKFIIVKWGNRWEQISKIYSDAAKQYKASVSVDRDLLFEKNMGRLEHIFDEQMEKNQLTQAVHTIEALNKMAQFDKAMERGTEQGEIEYHFDFS